MDNNEASSETCTCQDVNPAKEIAIGFLQGTAVTAGVLAGLLAVGLTVNKVQEKLQDRKAKKQRSKLTLIK